MFNNTLVYPVGDRSQADSIREQIQIALAIADEGLLKSLLVDAFPAIAPLHQIGAITSTVGMPVDAHEVADGLIRFDRIHCVLAESQRDIEEAIAAHSVSADGYPRNSELAKLTQCEAETRELGHNLSLAQAVTILSHAGFSADQVQMILHLPTEAWHKTWWLALDELGHFTLPFRRRIRTRRFADGTFTLQYKDYFAEEKPPCFKSDEHTVLIAIASQEPGFGYQLQKINYLRQRLGIQQVILICDRLSELEAQGFIHQGVSLYGADHLLLPTQCDCTLCTHQDCPMNGRADSPVMTCRRFCLGEWSES